MTELLRLYSVVWLLFPLKLRKLLLLLTLKYQFYSIWLFMTKKIIFGIFLAIVGGEIFL